MKSLSIAVLSFGLLCANAYAGENQAIPSSNPASAQLMLAEQNKAEGVRFLLENKKKPGVAALPDGLQYKVITQGNGPKPKITDTVTVNYAGTLINGKEFDSSYKRHAPATFPVNGVIPGWTEALQLMPVGSTWMLYIPSELAYGEQGTPPDIEPNKMLIFKVELLGINKS
jgi:FKBP-type peptidyl-prolyl cis-trans isomerase FklB